jgi:WD40 repeat protein/serine/threonine protein kinase
MPPAHDEPDRPLPPRDPPAGDPEATPAHPGQAPARDDESGALDLDVTASRPPGSDGPGPMTFPRRFGNYELLAEVARGGMGVVYKARLLGADRVVALKMILAGDFAAAGAVGRFRAEAKAAANLDHPGIVPIYDIGEAEGRPYFTMPLVEGGSLQQVVAAGPLPARAAARLVRQVAEAVQHAHERGVVHRDLKPSNVLLQPAAADGGGAAAGERAGGLVPRLTDFGLARAVAGAESGMTGTGDVLGTPGYMAPEQAAGRTREVGPRSDVYGLGALLYCLLTGRPPFQAATRLDTLVQVLSEEPVPPRRLNRQVPADLETVCLRCLAKELHRRYPTAKALAEELARFEAGRPVLARPMGRLERGWRWCRRNPALAASLASVAGSLVLGIAVASWLAVRESEQADLAARREGEAREEKERADRQAEEATKARDEARRDAAEARRQKDAATRAAYAAQIAQAITEMQSGSPHLASAALEATQPELRGWEYGYLRRQAEGTPLVLRARGDAGPAVALLGSGSSLLAWSPDGARLATDAGRTVRVWDARTGKEVLRLEAGDGPVVNMAWAPDGARLAAATGKGVWVWESRAGRRVAVLETKDEDVTSLAWSPDGARLATGSQGGTLRVWDATTGRPSLEVRDAGGSPEWSPDGTRLATVDAGEAGGVRVWDARTGARLRALPSPDAAAQSVSWSPDGSRLATGSWDGPGVVWDACTGERVKALEVAAPARPALAAGFRGAAGFGALGALGVGGGFQGLGGGFQGLAGGALGALGVGGFQGLVGGGGMTAPAWSPDGSRLAAATAGQTTVRVWDVRAWREAAAVKHDGAVGWWAWSPDGVRLATADGMTVRVWNVRTGTEALALRSDSGAVLSMRWSPDGVRLATTHPDGSARVWDARADGRALALGHAEPNAAMVLPLTGRLRWSPGGPWLLATHMGGTARAWDVRSGRAALELTSEQENDTVTGPAWSPDGARLAAPDQGAVRVWDVKTGRTALELTPAGGASLVAWAWSPDGRRLATATDDKTARVWDADTGRVGVALTHDGEVSSVAWGPDGSQLATAQADGTARVWDATTGKVVLERKGGGDPLPAPPAWSPDGARLAVASGGGTSGQTTLRVWDIKSGHEALALKVEGDITSLAWGPDGSRLVAETSADNLWDVHVWDAATGKPVLSLKGEGVKEGTLAWAPGGGRLAAALQDKGVRVWDVRTGREEFALRGHGEDVNAVAWSPDGARLATAADDRTARVWDATTGRQLMALRHAGPVSDVAFSPDGFRLATAAPVDSVVRIWDARPGPGAAGGDDPWAEDEARRSARAFDRHADDADEAAQGGDGFAAAFHAGRLRGLAPSDTFQRLRRGVCWLRLGWRDEGLADLAHPDVARALRGGDPLALTWHPLACLARGDRDGYRADCVRALEDPQVGVWGDAVWLNCLHPDGAHDLRAVVGRAEQAVAANPRDLTGLRNLGVALLRAGRFQEAVGRLGEAMTLREGSEPYEELLVALACQKLGRPEAARRWLARAGAWMDRYGGPARALGGVGAGPAGALPALAAAAADRPDPLAAADEGRLQRRLEMEILRAEVETALAGRDPVP